MKTLIGKHFTPFLVLFVGTLILLAGLFAAGKISPREMGYASFAVCLAAAVILTLLIGKTTRETRPVTQLSEARGDPTTRKKIIRSIRTCKVAIVLMPLILVYGLWATRNGPLLPRIVGVVINIATTGVFVVALKRQIARLRQ
jgi:hypothetical protein